MDISNHNYALYYPRICFQDPEWLFSAALLWDRIYRIVPSDFTVEDQKWAKALCESGEIGICINPVEYASEIATEFMDKVEYGHWNASALQFKMPEEYATIHQDKMDVKLRKMLLDSNIGTDIGEWVQIPTSFETLYMTYLATHIAEKNDLCLVSDLDTAWTATAFFQYDGNLDIVAMPERHEYVLANLIIQDYCPQNISSVSPSQILKYREKYRDERIRFMESIKNAAKSLSSCTDQQILTDMIEDIKKDITTSLDDYKKSLSVLNVTGWCGYKSISFPMITALFQSLFPHAIEITTQQIIGTVCLGLGIVTGITEMNSKKRELSKKSDLSYLYQLRKMHPSLYRKYWNTLYRNIEEFIND